jgi:hypothetical protein
MLKEEDDFSKGKRGAVIPPDPRKTRITIRIDTKILNWFRQTVNEAGGGNYQTMINEALKRYIESEAKKTIHYPGGPHVKLDEQYQGEYEAEGMEFQGRGYDLRNKIRDLGFSEEKAA